ncbi:uncharacterized protein LOC118267750 isoform X2 [Spodoptera frugiperda]|uniref:Uncharacterized protein LOC118267750 isoform X2 n=1 Tax=Spodoptera frugiperda TaxID=7108 RepID=A0A9R0DNR7_SPOFR|nr:uncharacterized protein LOC118267750 isoform X2 [Spodoptera frugiperda]
MDNKDFLIYSKCCFCIPLRFGLLTWAYVKLALIVVVTYLMVNIIKQVTSNSEVWHISALLVLLFVELCLTVMFIIAGHKYYNSTSYFY